MLYETFYDHGALGSNDFMGAILMESKSNAPQFIYAFLWKYIMPSILNIYKIFQ